MSKFWAACLLGQYCKSWDWEAGVGIWTVCSGTEAVCTTKLEWFNQKFALVSQVPVVTRFWRATEMLHPFVSDEL
jgi:hypothetical protein